MSLYDLKDAKVGDAVRVSASYGVTKQIVVRTTATQVVLDSGKRFTRAGRMVGESHGRFRNRTYAQPWDEAVHAQEMRDAAEKQERSYIEGAILNISRGTLSIDQLRRIAAIIAEPKL